MGRAWLRRRCRGCDGPASHSSGPRRPPQGPRRRHSQPHEAVPVGGAVLPIPSDGHLLEVRDSAELRW